MLTLTSGKSSIVIAPECGAGLIGWTIGQTPLLRRALPQAAVGGDPHALGCFPLLPYGNRLGNCQFRWLGRDYTLRRNFGDNPHSIHGLGWQRTWAVEASSSRSVKLRLEHDPDSSWPFAFTAQLVYDLSDIALTIMIQMTNRHVTAAPAGIGVHPFFPKANDPWLQFDATGVWENGADALPVRHELPPPEWRHQEPRRVQESRLDNCFTGWDGRAEILAGPASLKIEASPLFRHLQVFTPSWTDFFCVEPVSHMPDAINRTDAPPEQAMDVLEPNATLAGTVRFMPTG